MNTENTKTNETQNVVPSLLQRLELRSSNKRFALRNLFIYCTCKNVKQQYKSNKLKIKAPAWNDEFILPDGFYSMSDTQDYIEHMVAITEALPTNLKKSRENQN